MSALAHLAVVVGGFFVGWIVTMPEPDRPPPIASFFDPGLGAPGAAPIASAPPETGAPATDAGSAPIAPLALSAPEPLGSEPPPRAMLLGSGVEPTLPMPAPAVSGATLALQRRVPDIRFLGVRSSNAESIVYVVDATGSMLTTMPIVQRELLASIERLTPVQQYQVVTFSGSGADWTPHPDIDPGVSALRMLRATTENKRSTAAWLDSLIPGGRATPIEALRKALALRPDVVFLLSAGDNAARDPGAAEGETRAILAELEVLNPVDARTDRRQVPIKVVQFLNPDASGLLTAIADSHGGRDALVFVSRESLGME